MRILRTWVYALPWIVAVLVIITSHSLAWAESVIIRSQSSNKNGSAQLMLAPTALSNAADLRIVTSGKAARRKRVVLDNAPLSFRVPKMSKVFITPLFCSSRKQCNTVSKTTRYKPRAKGTFPSAPELTGLGLIRFSSTGQPNLEILHSAELASGARTIELIRVSGTDGYRTSDSQLSPGQHTFWIWSLGTGGRISAVSEPMVVEVTSDQEREGPQLDSESSPSSSSSSSASSISLSSTSSPSTVSSSSSSMSSSTSFSVPSSSSSSSSSSAFTAGNDKALKPGSTIVLSGSAGGATNLMWRQIGGPPTVIESPNAASTRIIYSTPIPNTTHEVVLTFQFSGLLEGEPVADEVKVYIVTKQGLVSTLRTALSSFWNNAKVEFTIDNRTYVGFSSGTTIDGQLPRYWENEFGAQCRDRVWDFQGRDGVGGVLKVLVEAYRSTGDKAYLRKARLLGDSLLRVQQASAGGWYQDISVINGAIQNVDCWGGQWPVMVHPIDAPAPWFTLDDKTSQSCAVALSDLYSVGGGEQYLAGAIQFGTILDNLRNYTEPNGARTFANGGLPQVFPMEVAINPDFRHNGANSPNNPEHIPYMGHKTTNDNSTADAIVALWKIYQQSGQVRFYEAARRNVTYLLDRQNNSMPGWGQQYHRITDELAWGRHMEPPFPVTAEHMIVPTLLFWYDKETDQSIKQRIVAAINRYLLWLRDELPRPPGSSGNILWRYYMKDGGLWHPLFALNYQLCVGAGCEATWGTSQPMRVASDLSWVNSLMPTGSLDVSRFANYANSPNVLNAGINPANWATAYLSRNREIGAWPTFPSYATYPGQVRIEYTTGINNGYALGLANQVADRSNETLSDSDGDGCSDQIEMSANTDPFDSDSFNCS